MAAAMTIISKEANGPSSSVPATIGSQESAMAKLTIAIAILTRGVRNPINRHAPHAAIVRHVRSTPSVRLPP